MLNCIRSDELPPLAWLLNLSGNHPQLTCGQSVEVLENRFFEGAWAGKFEDMNFQASDVVCGSGGLVTETGVRLVTPSHTLEAIYVFGVAGRWSASNSLPFLLTANGLKLAFRYPSTLYSFVEIVGGLDHAQSIIDTDKGQVHIVRYFDIALADSLKILPKTERTAPFVNFTEYEAYLVDRMASVATNAKHQSRRTKYDLIATVSTGYDSPACACLAHRIGCQTGLTIAKSRDGYDDDGTRIGEAIGLAMKRIERPDSSVLARDSDCVASFFATGMQGDDINSLLFSDDFRKKLVVTGFQGLVWDISTLPNAHLKRGDISGSSLGEFRLETDFVSLVPPFIAAVQLPSILEIGKSSEMKPWSVGGSYDKPIARRIAETAGVPRGSFGVRKKATAQNLSSEDSWPESTRRLVTDIGRAEVTAGFNRRYPLFRRLHKAVMRMNSRSLRIIRHIPSPLRTLCRRVLNAPALLIYRRRMHIIYYFNPFQIYVLAWALHLRSQKYQRILANLAE